MFQNVDVNLLLTKSAKMIQTLSDSPYAFRVYGSFRLGGHHNGSDYNFFIQRSKEVREFLFNLGFEKEEHAFNYSDIYCCGNVTVALVDDEERFERTVVWFSQHLKMYAYLKKQDSQTAQQIWSFAYELN